MIELDTEAVVIGSGFGGSVVASRLIDEGVAVIMLERGPWRNTVPVKSMNVRNHAELPRKSFGQLIRNAVQSVYHHRFTSSRGFGINRNTGVYEAHLHKGFISVASSQVGGGSLIYGGLIDRPLDPDFWNDVAVGVSEEILAPHFDRVKSELGVISVNANKFGFPRHLPETLQKDSRFDLTINADLMLAHKLPKNQQSHQGSDSPAYGIERRESKLKESLSFGCLDGSKASTDAIYLGPALAKGLHLLAQCEVESVQKQASGGYCVYATHKLHKKRIKVHCKNLFMGAGAYNTVRLLMEAQRNQGLNPMPGLGKGMGNNGDDLSLLLNATTADGKEDPPGLVTAFTLPDGNPGIMHGVINTDIPQPDNKLLRWLLGPVLRSSIVLGMGRDLGNGVATLSKNCLKIDYEPGKQETNRAVAEGNRATVKALGMKAIRLPKPITAHLFGGARVSQEATEGVVNGFGECHQNQGLYIVDAAVTPKAPGRAPSLNIATWASHVAENAIHSCDTQVSTNIQTDIDRVIKQAKAGELAMLFSSLLPAKAAESHPPVCSWTLTTLTADRRWFNGRFKFLFNEELSLEFLAADSNMEYLKPQTAVLDRPVLANSWDGSGLVYQITTEVKGELITMQLRKLPDQETWLLRSANEREFLGWHLLIQ